uniref:NADH-ubiquinone oxidoreductase chain 3 n=1 Tax=Brentidae sp. GENSP01 TaxID=1205806 RepID=A0A0S2MQQ7_9CUCU|nr:NADH deshydrogenase subunit 3 [Brentidae sp. GENSP01]
MMKMMFSLSFLIFFITTILILVLNLTAKKTFYDREKSSPFECGFNPKNSARLPFSMQFFLIAVIFLIFDVELTLILPFIMIFSMSNLIYYIFTFLFILFILLIGLYHEWNQGALNWQF